MPHATLTMKTIAFIGLGNMGGPMATNLVKAGYIVRGFDLAGDKLKAAEANGIQIANSAADAAANTDVVITMLLAGDSVRAVYGETLPAAPSGTLFIDCSTIDVDSARAVHTLAIEAGMDSLDAPVSGGISGADAGTLTFMVGGTKNAFNQAGPLLQIMGSKVVHCGGAGDGQAVKICNNMMLGIQMASVCEGFTLAHKLGVDPAKLFEVSSTSSGQCWSLTTYCPEPGLVPTAPSNNDYKPGFATDLMLKDMDLALAAAESQGLKLDVATVAQAIYEQFSEQGHGDMDFSGIIQIV